MLRDLDHADGKIIWAGLLTVDRRLRPDVLADGGRPEPASGAVRPAAPERIARPVT